MIKGGSGSSPRSHPRSRLVIRSYAGYVLALEDTAIITDTSPTALAHAIEENGAEFLLALGRAGGGEERADSLVHWSIGGSPIDYHNAVVRAQLTGQSVA